MSDEQPWRSGVKRLVRPKQPIYANQPLEPSRTRSRQRTDCGMAHKAQSSRSSRVVSIAFEAIFYDKRGSSIGEPESLHPRAIFVLGEGEIV